MLGTHGDILRDFFRKPENQFILSKSIKAFSVILRNNEKAHDYYNAIQKKII